MKKILIVLLFVVSFMFPVVAFGQIQPTPKSYQKIKFMYQKKSNFSLDEKGFYADTTQFKLLFPDFAYQKITSSNGTLMGFAPLEQLNILQKKIILEKLTHDNVIIYGTVEAKKNSVTFSIDHNNPETNFAYRLFNLPQTLFNSTYSYTYKKNFSTLEIYAVATTQIQSIKKNTVLWQNTEQLIGQYTTQEAGVEQINVVQFSADLPRLITPIAVFDNSAYGIKTLYGIENHYRLISVVYE